MQTLTPLLALALAAPLANAGIDDFVTATVPDFRGESGARFDGYDVFTQGAFLPNFPDLDGSCAGTSLTQLDPAGIVTASGSIYSFGTVTSFRLDFQDAEPLLELSIQTRTIDFGAPFAGSSFLLRGTDGSGASVSVAPTAVNLLGPLANELEIVWDAATLAGLELTDANVTFNAADISCATDVVLVDYRVDREPLETDTDSLSVGLGGVQAFDLDAGASRAGDFYFLLGSSSGTAGIPFGDLALPLTLDAYTNFTLGFANSPTLPNSFGSLDACGFGSAALNVPAGTNPNLAGLTFFHAFLTLDAATLQADFASNAAAIDFSL
ncbi:MAG: hypothetical protein AAFZ65_00670 [Planctomycetota bacterium]